MPRPVRLTLAINDTDQVRDVLSGVVPVNGVELTPIILEPEEIFFRFSRHAEWEITELSLGKYATMRARGDESAVAIPVFPSRAFRHSAIYIRPDGPVDRPDALSGARIGIPEWSVTAVIYARGILAHEYGVELETIHWVQGGTNAPGREEGLTIGTPPGFRIEAERTHSLSDLLLAGEIDAVIAPHPPTAAEDGSGRIVRLFSNARAVEERAYGRSGVYPIMHVVAIRNDVHRAYPWVAANLLSAFTEAKTRSLTRALDVNVPRSPIPWAAERARELRELFGGDPWPYGIDPNRTTLETFLRLLEEQGLAARRLRPEDLFAAETRQQFVV